MSKSERLSYYKQMIEAGKMTPNHIRKLEYNLIREKENKYGKIKNNSKERKFK